MGRAPLIGVTTSTTADGASGRPPRAHLNNAYLLAVQQEGGVPVLLPPHLEDRALDALWSRLDGLLLTGGGDIDPERFTDEKRHATVADVSEARDRLEITLTERALHEQRPLLAICRGVQVLNVALGGSLYQDIPSKVGRIAHTQSAPRQQATHPVKIMVEGTRLGATLGAPDLQVNSFHHQAIKQLGRGLLDVAWAPDEIIEAVEMPDAAGFVLGVQWHPEELVGHDPAARALFRALVTAAENGGR